MCTPCSVPATLFGSFSPLQFLKGIPSTNTSPICWPDGFALVQSGSPRLGCPDFGRVISSWFADGSSLAVLFGAKAKPLAFHNIPSGPDTHLQKGHSSSSTESSTLLKLALKKVLVLFPVIAAFVSKAILGSL